MDGSFTWPQKEDTDIGGEGDFDWGDSIPVRIGELHGIGTYWQIVENFDRSQNSPYEYEFWVGPDLFLRIDQVSARAHNIPTHSGQYIIMGGPPLNATNCYSDPTFTCNLALNDTNFDLGGALGHRASAWESDVVSYIVSSYMMETPPGYYEDLTWEIVGFYRINDLDWHPSGTYTEGPLSKYEDVAVCGECDQFAQQFWEEKFGVEFISGWWELPFEEQKINPPLGTTWNEYTGQAIHSGDFIVVDRGEEDLHAAIVDHVNSPLIITGGGVGTDGDFTVEVLHTGGTLHRDLIDIWLPRCEFYLDPPAYLDFFIASYWHVANTTPSGGWNTWEDYDNDVCDWSAYRYLEMDASPSINTHSNPQLRLTYQLPTVTNNHNTPAEWSATASLGDEQTVTFTGKYEGGRIWFDMGPLNNGERPWLKNVQKVEIIFGSEYDTVAWTISGLRLVKHNDHDPDRDEVTPHVLTTFHEPRWLYAAGGVRAVVDGLSKYALCEVENYNVWSGHEQLVKHINWLFGKVVDSSAAWGLAQYLGIISNCTQGWAASLPDNWDTLTLDDEDTPERLTNGYSFDLRELQDFDCDGGTIDCRFRGYKWETAPGLLYMPWGLEIVQGGLHGLSNKRSETGGKIYRREADSEDEWSLVDEDVTTNGHGYWPCGGSKTGYDLIKEYNGDTPVYWAYRVSETPHNTDYDRLYERQWEWSYLWIIELSIMLAEYTPNVVYVFEFDGIDISHIYTAPPDLWYSEGKTLSPYSLPHTDVESCDGSPSGYVEDHGFIYLYYVNENDLYRVISEDWGATWGDTTAVIVKHDIEKAFCYEQDGVETCVAVDGGGALKCFRSSTHFADSAWVVDANVFAIASGIDVTAQPSVYTKNGNVFVHAIKENVVVGYKSVNVGRTWIGSTIPTPIDGKKVFVFCDEGMQYAVVVGLSDEFLCYRSSLNFADTQWLEGINKFTISAVVDDAQITGYANYGYLYAIAFVDNVSTEWKSDDFGKTWTQMAI